MEKIIEELKALGDIYETAVEYLVTYSFQAIGAIFIILIGILAARYFGNITHRYLEIRKVDVTIRKYAAHIIRLLILFCFVVIALGKFGITIAPFVAALGAVTLGVGLAMQGILSNYGAGISIIITRPFKVGDTITIQEVSGIVKEIRLACTIVETEDLEHIMIPNKHVVGEIVLNTFESRMVETHIAISYDDDPAHAIKVINKVLEELDFVTRSPSPQIGIEAFADSGITMGARFWVPTERYYECKFLANLAIYQHIKDAGIVIPFPQLDVNNK